MGKLPEFLQKYINLCATAQSRGDQLAQHVLRIEAQMKIDIVCVKVKFGGGAFKKNQLGELLEF